MSELNVINSEKRFCEEHDEYFELVDKLRDKVHEIELQINTITSTMVDSKELDSLKDKIRELEDEIRDVNNSVENIRKDYERDRKDLKAISIQLDKLLILYEQVLADYSKQKDDYTDIVRIANSMNDYLSTSLHVQFGKARQEFKVFITKFSNRSKFNKFLVKFAGWLAIFILVSVVINVWMILSKKTIDIQQLIDFVRAIRGD